MSPLVSIIIPTFDRPHYLQEAIDAALAQTYRNIEVLVFDNGTLPETSAVGQTAAQRDARVTFRRNERNLGMSANFNALADASRGEFVVAIGDDDRLLPEFVDRLVGVMKPGLSVAFSNHYLIDASGRRLEKESKAHTSRYGRDSIPAGVMKNAEEAAWRLSIPMSASLLRLADLRRLRFREDLNTPDAEFFIRLTHEGAAFAFVPDYLMEYRVHLGAETAGGLWSAQLVQCLTAFEVRPEVEPYKRRFLSPMIVNAVSRYLQQGQMKKARGLLRNKYYPHRGGSLWSPDGARPDRKRAFSLAFGGLLQSFCAHLPAAVGAPLYRAIRQVRLARRGP